VPDNAEPEMKLTEQGIMISSNGQKQNEDDSIRWSLERAANEIDVSDLH
jgi:hypothetical protein